MEPKGSQKGAKMEPKWYTEATRTRNSAPGTSKNVPKATPGLKSHQNYTTMSPQRPNLCKNEAKCHPIMPKLLASNANCRGRRCVARGCLRLESAAPALRQEHGVLDR